MAAPVEAVVTLKSGEQRIFRQEIHCSEGKNQYVELRENLKKVQSEVNACLTQQVELEKSDNQQNASGDKKRVTADDSGEEDEEEADHMDEAEKGLAKRTKDTDKETHSKKQKTE